MVHIIVKQSYNHYNTSLGMQIKNKDHYDRVCKERGMVSYEKAQEMAEKGRKDKIKDYKISKDSIALIQSIKQTADSKGNVKLGDKAIKALIDKKAIGKKIPENMVPKAYNAKGGFL